MIFVLWLYLVELSLTKKEKGFSYLQFVISFPLIIFLGSNAYLSGFIFGYVFVFVISLSATYILSVNLLELNKTEK
jgi:hypothetical protein